MINYITTYIITIRNNSSGAISGAQFSSPATTLHTQGL